MKVMPPSWRRIAAKCGIRFVHTRFRNLGHGFSAQAGTVQLGAHVVESR